MADQYVPKPSSNLGFAIFTTLCCCLPFGIVAIIKASKVNDLYAIGQYQAAEMASNDAKKWSIIALVAGLIFDIIYFVFYGAYIAAVLGGSF